MITVYTVAEHFAARFTVSSEKEVVEQQMPVMACAFAQTCILAKPRLLTAYMLHLLTVQAAAIAGLVLMKKLLEVRCMQCHCSEQSHL